MVNINLVFPPLVSPSCVPVGMAYLKAYAEKYVPGTRVNLIDLNPGFIHTILDGRFARLSRICKPGMAPCASEKSACIFRTEMHPGQKKIFKKARSIVKGGGLFYHKEVFQKYFGDCHVYVSAVNECMTKILTLYNEGKLGAGQAVMERFKNEIGTILSGRPDMVGFSVLVDGQINYALALARMVKQERDIPVVLGGPALFNFKITELMDAFGFIDGIVVKEGELSIAGLARRLHDRDRDYSGIPNLIWRKNAQVAVNGIRCVGNLDELPTPDFGGLNLKEYFFPEIILPLSTSRGCPWSRCTFCQLNAQYAGSYRVRSIDKVMEDIVALKRTYGAGTFFFTDSELSAGRLLQLGKSILDRGLDISFACYARPTKGLNAGVIKTVAQAGGRLFQLGVESFSDAFLRSADKGTSCRSIRAVLKNADRWGIKSLVYMLAGCPRQTRRELLNDLKVVASMQKKYGIFSVVYCLYALGIHQRMYHERKSQGIVLQKRTPVFVTARGMKVYSTNWRPYTYKNRSAYHILKGRGAGAQDRLDFYVDRFGINGGNRDFARHINNFLFETQLLFCARNRHAGSHSPASAKALRFYADQKAALLADVYKAGRR